jgi:VanZ family protein
MPCIHPTYQPFFYRQRFFSLTLLIIVLTFITFQAMLNAQQSTDVSSGLTQVIVDVIEVVIPSTNDNQDVYQSITYWVRKGIGHIGLNGVNGLFFLATLLGFFNFKHMPIFYFLGALIFSLYGELLQLFADGRAPMVEDVFYNLSGYILLFLFLTILLRNKKNLAN